jgi:class 3 adenylate cyclase/tetratricopeptide (TPR) repeat protein
MAGVATLGSAPVGIAGERKLVTLLFADVVGSTALAEHLDPEEWGEIVSGAHSCVADAIHSRGGTIAQLLGDGVLAFFGAPATHEDDPVRAVSAALQILDSMRTYARQLAEQRRIDNFQMRVGLNTGLVVVGNIGSEFHMEYLAVGDSVNLAARLQSAAAPNSVLISANTARLVRHAFELDAVGPLELKGKSEPITAFHVIARKTERESSRGIQGLFAPLIGRDAEFSRLRDRFAEFGGGRGQIVSLMGEAGLGKSRLLAELKRAVTLHNGSAEATTRPVTWIEGHALSDETTIPYALIISALGNWLGTEAATQESDEERYASLTARLGQVVGDRVADIAPYVATLLGIALIGDASERVKYLEPPMLRGRTFDAVTEVIRGLAGHGPVALVFEDLHWADSTSLDLIERLLSLTERRMLLILAAFRPQRQEPSWRFYEIAERDHGHRHCAVRLEPLDEVSSRALVANLLHIEDLPENVRTLILRKAEGNPFFIEEMIRSLLDSKLVVREQSHWRATQDIADIAIPDTLSEVIGARIDRLDRSAKRVIQTASVIGREFQLDLLTDIMGTGNGLDDALDDLQRRELVQESARTPAVVYSFKHALTRETAYASLLLSRRRELHSRVAQAMERHDPDRVNDIARHFLEARDERRALPYLVEAAERSGRAYANTEAIEGFSRALDMLKTVEDVPLTRRAYEGLGGALMLAGDMQRAMDTYHVMLHFAVLHHDDAMRVSAQNKLAMALLWQGRFPEIEDHLLYAERLAHEILDFAGLAELHGVRCAVCTIKADFGTAIKHLNESVQIGRELNLREQLLFGQTHCAHALGYMTEFDEMWKTAQDGLALSEDMGDLKHRADLLVFPVAFHHLLLGNLAAAYQAAEEGRRLSVKIGAAMAEASGGYMAGTIAWLQGEYETAIERLQGAREAGRISGWIFIEAMPLAGLGTVYTDLGERFADRVLDAHQQSLAVMERPTGASAGGVVWAELGFYALAKGDLVAAEEYFQKGLTIPTPHGLINRPRFLIGLGFINLTRGEVASAAANVAAARSIVEERGMRHLAPLIGFGEAQTLAAGGDLAGAVDKLGQAEALALTMHMRPMAWQAQAGAAHILAALGRTAEAHEKQQSARRIIDEIAGLFADAELRRSFVATSLARLEAS